MRSQGSTIARAAILAAGLGLLASSPAGAATYYLAVDVPSELSGTDFTTEQIVRSADGLYLLDEELPPGTALSAFHQEFDGAWLLSPAHPVTLGGVEVEPRDVAAQGGGVYSVQLDGGAAGIPAGARIDALLRAANGNLVLSFDVPVNLGGTEFSRSDLVIWQSGVFSLYWDAEAAAAGVPASSNLVGAALTGVGEIVLTFDVPTTLGGTTYLPGELVRWTGGGFTSHLADPSWPASSQLRDFAFLPAAGSVGATADAEGGPLVVDYGPGGDISVLTLSWGVSCGAGDVDFEVYEGTIGGTFTNHEPILCTTFGQHSVVVTPAGKSTYYLVVPRNGVAEGSYGLRSDGSERPVSASACLPQSISGCSP
jgi:hypothetical protein